MAARGKPPTDEGVANAAVALVEKLIKVNRHPLTAITTQVAKLEKQLDRDDDQIDKLLGYVGDLQSTVAEQGRLINQLLEDGDYEDRAPTSSGRKPSRKKAASKKRAAKKKAAKKKAAKKGKAEAPDDEDEDEDEDLDLDDDGAEAIEPDEVLDPDTPDEEDFDLDEDDEDDEGEDEESDDLDALFDDEDEDEPVNLYVWVNDFVNDKSIKGGKAKYDLVKQVLREMGAKKLKEIDPSETRDFVERVEALVEESL